MAEVDAFVQYSLFYYVSPLILLYLFYKLFRNQIRATISAFRVIIHARVKQRYSEITWKQKKRLLSNLHDFALRLDRPLILLEIGIDCGDNIELYPNGTDLIAVDTHPHFRRYVNANLEDCPHVNLLEFITCRPGDMFPLPDESVDAVVFTETLYEIQEIDNCLSEAERILRPQGRIFYLEPTIQETRKLYFLLHKVWSRLNSLICQQRHMRRDVTKHIKAARFTVINQEHFDVATPTTFFTRCFVCPSYMQHHVSGIAKKEGIIS